MAVFVQIRRLPIVCARNVCFTPKGPQTHTKLHFQLTRNYANQTRLATKRAAAKQGSSLKEAVSRPADGSAIVMGRALLAGAGVAGIGALCYYGAGMSSEHGVMEKAAFWPDYVRDRVRSTYTYFGLGLASTAGAAIAMSRNPALMMRIMPKSWVGAIAGMAVVMGSGMLTMAIPYSEGLGVKQLAWLGHSALLGVILSPMCMMGGPLLIKAAWYTAGVVGGLSCVAACAPNEKFLYMGGPLAMGLGVIVVASIGGMFFPVTSALGSGLYAVSTYGGVVLFGGFVLYDTQLIMKKAEMYPVYSERPFDPINSAMGIYMDTINIFIRLAMILSGGGGKRK